VVEIRVVGAQLNEVANTRVGKDLDGEEPMKREKWKKARVGPMLIC